MMHAAHQASGGAVSVRPMVNVSSDAGRRSLDTLPDRRCDMLTKFYGASPGYTQGEWVESYHTVAAMLPTACPVRGVFGGKGTNAAGEEEFCREYFTPCFERGVGGVSSTVFATKQNALHWRWKPRYDCVFSPAGSLQGPGYSSWASKVSTSCVFE